MKDFETAYRQAVKFFAKKQYAKTAKQLQPWLAVQGLNDWQLFRLYEAYGNTCMCQAELETALCTMEKALQLNLTEREGQLRQQRLASNYLMYLHYLPDDRADWIGEKHQRYGKLFFQPSVFQHMRKDKEKIRIGYLSSDFFEHIVTNFSVQLYAGYDRSRYEVMLYCTGGVQNEVTEWLKSMTDGWRDFTGMDPAEAARLIYADDVDILFDLTGHTDGGAGLRIMAYHPAKIQLAGIGYFDTTGLAAVDYFLSDIYCDPQGNERYFTEQLLRLPHSHFCYTPPERVALCKSVWQPQNTVVFGSFNNFAKITDNMLETWLQILNKVPGSKLILKHVKQDREMLQRMQSRAAKIGYQAGQLELRGGSPDYLAEYAEIDIALDTYPYPGGGTTCETLYMGVPVISRYGERHGSRFGYSLLVNVGIGELAAATEQEYIEKAVSLAHDRDLLSLLHQNLRPMMIKSPVMDARNYVSEVEKAYQNIWQHWLGEGKE